MYCKYLSKALNGKIRCRKYKRYISSLLVCKNCSDFIVVKNKGINKVSNKQKKLNNNRFSIFTNNFYECYYCKRKIKENEKIRFA